MFQLANDRCNELDRAGQRDNAALARPVGEPDVDDNFTSANNEKENCCLIEAQLHLTSRLSILAPFSLC